MDQFFKFYIQELLKKEKKIESEELKDMQIVFPTRRDLYFELLCAVTRNDIMIENMTAFAHSIYIFVHKVQLIKNQARKKEIDEMIQLYQMDVSNKYLNKYVADRTALSTEEVSALYNHLIEDIVNLIEEHEKEKLQPMLNYFTEEIGYQIS